MGKKIIWILSGIGFLLEASYNLYNKNVEKSVLERIILLSENFESNGSGMIQLKFKISSSWTNWNDLKFYTANASGTDSFYLTNQVPADSVQFRFFYSDSTSSLYWEGACDNVIAKRSVYLDHDVGIAQIVSPTGTIVIGNPVNVIVKYGNFGNNPETFPAIVRIFDPSSAPVFSKDTNLTLNAGEQIEVNFGQWIPTQQGSHFIYGKTLLSGDEYPQNDSLGQTFSVSLWGQWTSYSPPPINADRFAHATVYDPQNDKIYMIGGITASKYRTSDIYRYDPLTNTWTTNLENMPDARAWIQGGYWNGRIYVPGGLTNLGTNSNTFFIYEIASNLWIVGPTLPEARCAYGLAVWNGNIYVIGGLNPALNAGTTTVYRFNIPNTLWTTATSIPQQFDMGGCCYLGDTIYLIGGYNRGAGQVWTQVLRGVIDNNNPDNITWTWITNLPYPNMNNAACALPGKIYMIGGFINGQTVTDKVWEYDITTNTWTELPQYVVPIARDNFACTRPEIGGVGARIYVVAGDAYGNWVPPNNYYYYLERGVSVSEKNLIEKPRIFFIKPSITKGDFGIHFALEKKSNVDVSIYSITGQEIVKIYKGIKESGNHVIRCDASKLNPGVYFIILKTDQTYFSRIIKIK